MASTLGKRRYALPIVVILAVLIIFPTMFYPMANMQVKDLPFAFLNHDKEIATAQGPMNLGSKVAEQIGGSGAIKLRPVSSQAEIDELFEDQEIYGAIVIPENFTASALAARLGQGELEPAQITLDRAKSPMIVNQLQAGMSQMLSTQAFQAEQSAQAGPVAQGAQATPPAQGAQATPVQITVIHEGPDVDTSSPLGTVIVFQMSVLPLVIASFIAGFLVYKVLGGGAKGRPGKSLAAQLGYGVLAALVIGVGVTCVVHWVAGIPMEWGTGIAFYSLCAFFLFTFFNGMFNLHVVVGGLAALCTIVLGAMTAVLPAEVLPSFWANYVIPWAPQGYMSAGLREILYLDGGAWNAGTLALLCFFAVGLLAYAGRWALARRK